MNGIIEDGTAIGLGIANAVSRLKESKAKSKVIILLTDGHPNNGPWKKELENLETKPWFRVALRYGIAIELQDQKAIDVLNAYTSQNGEVIKVLDANILKQIIKIIVLTASKVQSTSSNTVTQGTVKKVDMVRQQIIENITDVDDWEW